MNSRGFESWSLPRHLGGPRVELDPNDPPLPPAPPPPPPPAPPPVVHQTPPAPPPAPRPPAASDDPAALRAEAAAYRVDARTARDQLAAAQAETERVRLEAEQRVTAATTTAQQTTQVFKNCTRDAELKAAALQEGLVDQDLIGLIDKTGIVVGDDGTVTGVTEAVAAFKVKKPSYFTAPSAPPTRRIGDPTPPPPINPGPPAPTDVRAQSKADYEAAKRAATASLRGR